MNKALMPLEEALEGLLQSARGAPIEGVEQVSLDEADGRVLAEPVQATLDLPPWPNSAMDGYALALDDWQGQPLPIGQRIFAGHAPEPLASGTCARIFTGAPLPPGADTVEMQENVIEEDGQARFGQAMKRGQHVRPRAQEVRTGEQMLDAGTRLGPVELGLIASLGLDRVAVRRRPVVALLSTGDELVEPGQALAPGQIYNSNRRLLQTWLNRLGCRVQDVGILPDDLQRTRELLGALGEVDLILSTGGVSVGEADFLGQALREGGSLTFWKLAIKPGKPLTFGHFKGVPVLGLPGNPASTLVTFGLLARPYLLARLGVTRLQPLGFEVPVDFDWPEAGSRREYLRARLVDGRVQRHPNQSSGVLRSAAWADGFAELLEGRTLRAGDTLRFIPMSELIG